MIPDNSTAASPGAGRRAGAVGWLLLSPMLLWLAALVVVPTTILLAYSFATPIGPARVRWSFSLGGYWQLFEGVAFRTLLRSIYFALITTLLCGLIGYPVAYFIGRAAPRWRNRLLMLVMVPFWTSFLIRTYGWIIVLRDHGLLNAALASLRITSDPLEILYTPAAELIGLVYTFVPFMILPIYGSVEKLDDSLIEAAFDLGASPLAAFLKVIVPLTLPGIVAGSMLVFVPAVGMFAVSDILGGKRTPLIGNLIEQQFVGKGGDWAFGSAMGIALLVMFIVSYMILARLGRRQG
jgi:spermidine/putrescine transport system permease protein